MGRGLFLYDYLPRKNDKGYDEDRYKGYSYSEEQPFKD
jgi:hypothetical protein